MCSQTAAGLHKHPAPPPGPLGGGAGHRVAVVLQKGLGASGLGFSVLCGTRREVTIVKSEHLQFQSKQSADLCAKIWNF